MDQINNLKNNGTFDIATGKSRKEINWKNQVSNWASFLNRISVTHRTAETLREYIDFKKPLQDERKDIGGYVGGYIINGRRKAENITLRQLITLDNDFSKGGLWDDFLLTYPNSAALYSTHKHSKENPRYRLIIPLNRPVSNDEYVAIARRIAGDLDINTFDDTTFEPSRLMYWPSTAKDGEFVFEFQDGPWLCADEVLSRYKNWKDASEWPVSDRAGKVLQHEIKKQGDPFEKPGMVGVFCRTYDIHKAIEIFLPEVYEACDVEDRYTFKEGSTAAGLITYDDKFAYSHHGTDPASGKLCNAFDLVRIHLYGLKDEDAKDGTPVTTLPSYKAMEDLCTKDSKVRQQLGIEKLQRTKEEFSEQWEGEEADTEWLELMAVDKKGDYRNTIDNIKIVLSNDPRTKKKFAFNKFEQREVALGDLPWRKLTPEEPYLQDADVRSLRHYLEKNYGIKSRLDTDDALSIVLRENEFHPVRDYLTSVTWDGDQRLDTLFIDYLGAEDNDYVRAVTRKVLVAAVTRIFRPGCKFDYVIVLIGTQGIGKSSIIKKLGGKWYSDSFTGMQGKEAFEQIQGVWILELAELAGLKKAELETIKHFISKTDDRYRVAYGKRTENFARQCVFIGTTNDRDFLKDPSGNRRFWPIDTREVTPIKSIWKDLSQYEIDQIWAEAVKFYKADEPLFLNRSLEQQAYIHQTEHREVDDRTGLVQGYLDTLLPENWAEMDQFERRRFIEGDKLQAPGTIQRKVVCTYELWCELFGKQKGDITPFNTKDLNNILGSIPGWKKGKGNKNFPIYERQRFYERIVVEGNALQKKIVVKKEELNGVRTN